MNNQQNNSYDLNSSVSKFSISVKQEASNNSSKDLEECMVNRTISSSGGDYSKIF